MSHFYRLRSQSSVQLAVALVAVGSWLSGCGDDDGGDGMGKGGSSGASGSAGASTGGSAGAATGGSAGTPAGGTAGTPSGGTGGSGGSPGGGSGGASAGSAGDGMGGEGMGGEGGMGEGGEAGTAGTAGAGSGGMAGTAGMGMGGEGGAQDVTCFGPDLSVMLVSAAPMQQHDHLPINGMARTTLVNMINSGTPLTFTLPEEGTNPHTHTLTFTAMQLTVLRNGGALAMNVTSSTGGPQGNQHTHTYAIECEP